MKTKIKKQTRRILVAALAILFAIGFAPQMSAPAYADDGDPDISLSSQQLAKEVNTDDAQTLWYGGRDWRVIAYDGKDADGNMIAYKNPVGETENLYQDGVVTLFQNDVLEKSIFNTIGDDWDRPLFQAYGTDGNGEASDLRKFIEKTYLNGDGETHPVLQEKEVAAIVSRTLPGYGYEWNSYTQRQLYDSNRINGNDLGDALVWPLSDAEISNVDWGIRVGSGIDYWLRSTGFTDTTVISVKYGSKIQDDGGIYHFEYTTYENGVRPAFFLDEEQILFTSAAFGGKESGRVGPNALKKVSGNSDNEWKVTLADPARSAFRAVSEDPENCVTPKFSYSGAATGANEYISAVIIDENENITYYGRLKQCSDDADASGELKINLKGKIKEGDELCVFNEQCNGDGATDYSSGLEWIDIPDSPHNLSKTDPVPATMKEPGNKAYWTCSLCGRHFGDEDGKTMINEGDWNIACPSIFNIPAVTYNGHEQTPAVSVADTSAQVISPDNYDVTYDNNINAGTNATVKVTFKGDFYSGEDNLTFTIKPASVAGASVTGVTSRIYTDKAQTQKPVVKIGGTTLQYNTDYVLSYKDNIKAGTAAVLIKGKGNYSKTKTVKFTIKKATNLLKVKGKTAAVKYSALKKKNQSVGVTRVVAFKNKGQGAKTYIKASGNKNITIAKKTGKVTVKKGLKKGTYKVTVKVKAAGNANYKASDVKKVAFKISVK